MTGILDASAGEDIAHHAQAERQALDGTVVLQLVPFSGIQFIDFEIDAAVLPMVSSAFVEETIDSQSGPRRVLLPIGGDTADGTLFHPITFRPLGPDDIVSTTGLEAIEHVLDTWIPLPYFRYFGNDAQGSPRVDQGPGNWARLYISTPAGGLRGTDRVKAVLAFDTRLDPASSSGRANSVAGGLAPGLDDALFGSTFQLVTAVDRLAGFVGQPWLDLWLRSLPGVGAGVATSADGYTLRHMARYLALLQALDRCADLPAVRFIDSVSTTRPVAVQALDLVIYVGVATTTALILPQHERLPPDLREAGARAVPLRLRDMAQPTVVHDGPIPTVVEFDHQTFGNAACSRRSGRPDAFAWSSLVRVGHEAQRLALRANATDGVTGGVDIAARLGETVASDVIWRFSTPDLATPRSGPMVTGDALRHVGEDGAPVARAGTGLLTDSGRAGDKPAGDERGGDTALPVVRPRFSQSSLVGFFLVEVLLHALSEINAADPSNPFAQSAAFGEGANTVRRIERIVVTTPLAMPTEERRILLDRVAGAIDIVWRTQGWDAAPTLPVPERPQVAVAIGTDVGLQLAYLYSEVRTKYGSFADLVDGLRRRTGEPDARDNLRIASIELNERSMGLTIVDYDVVHDGTVAAQLVMSERAAHGAARIVDAIVETVILPAISRGIAAAGLADPERFLDELGNSVGSGAGGMTGAGTGSASLARRLVAKALRPAARHMFGHLAFVARRSGYGVARTRLEGLVAAGGGVLDGLASEFDRRAQAAGARGFALGAVEIESSRHMLDALFEREFDAAMLGIADVVAAADCDLLLVGGDLGAMPDVVDRLVGASPVPPGRITVLAADATGSFDANGSDEFATETTVDPAVDTGRTGMLSTGTLSTGTRRPELPADLPAGAQALLAAYMAGRGMLVSDTFALSTADLAHAVGGNRDGLDSDVAPLSLAQSSLYRGASSERGPFAATADIADLSVSPSNGGAAVVGGAR